MASFDRYVPLGEFKFSDDDKDPDPPRGNLETVDKSKLTEANPKDLKIGKEYLLMNNETQEKTKGTFVKFDEMGDNDTEGTTAFQYYFKDKDGELVIEGDNVHIDEDKDDEDDEYYDDVYKNEDPYHKDIKFVDEYSVYIPKSSEILLGKKLNTDVAKVINEYGGKNKSKSKRHRPRQRKTRKSKRRQRKTRTIRRRKTQKSKRRR